MPGLSLCLGNKLHNAMKKQNMSQWPIPACLFIGLGLGILTGQVAAFVLIGLGIGILITYLASRKK
jgi:predicted ABC-type sugar transport system permease subunit